MQYIFWIEIHTEGNSHVLCCIIIFHLNVGISSIKYNVRVSFIVMLDSFSRAKRHDDDFRTRIMFSC